MAGPGAAGDDRFFQRAGPFSLAEVAAAAQGEARGTAPPLTGVAPLAAAGPAHVSFLDNRRYLEVLAGTGAGAVILHPDLAARLPGGCAAVCTPEPYLGWARVAALFHPVAAG